MGFHYVSTIERVELRVRALGHLFSGEGLREHTLLLFFHKLWERKILAMLVFPFFTLLPKLGVGRFGVVLRLVSANLAAER